MNIRHIEEKDIDAILNMITHYRKEQNVTINDSLKNEIRKQLAIVAKEKPDTTYVCIVQNEVAGYINMHICPFPMIGGKELYISDLLVKQNYRGKGIGKRLMNKAEETAQKHGCSRMMLNNAKEAESYKRSFYGKSGFTERLNFANFVKTLK